MHARHALLIGIDEYSNLEERYQLYGCVNDAMLVKRVLVDHFNFAGPDITELHNAAATRAGILGAMDQLVDCVNEDDIVVFHFSGHGSQRTSANLEEGTGMDSTIMPADSGRDPLPNLDIIDDEIHEWLGRLSARTRYITLTFDCCHSGTITRDVFGARTRSVKADTRSLADMGIDTSQLPRQATPRKREVGPSGWLALSNSYVVLSGCRDNELASEYDREDGGEKIRHGALTYFLTKGLMRAKPGTTYRDIFEPVRREVSTAFSDQHPQIEGAQDREVFGIRDIEPLRFVPVASVDGDKVTLDGGAAHGLASGSLWSVYPPETKQIEDTRPLGAIEVTSVNALTAEGAIRDGVGAISVGARCIEKVASARQNLLRVDLSALSDEARAQLADCVEKSRLLTIADSSEGGDARVYVLEPREQASDESAVPQIDMVEERCWAIVNLEGELAAPLRAVSDANALDIVISNLETTARYRNALRLDNPNKDLNVEFNIYRLMPDDSLKEANGGEFVFEDGDCIAFEVINKEDRDVFISVLSFGLTGRIALLYPPNSTSELIEKGQKLIIGQGKRKIRLSVPKDLAADSGTETYKVFVTTNEADFTWLQQAGTRLVNGSRSQLRRQFETAYDGPKTRDSLFDSGDEEEDEWITVARSFVVRRRL